MVIMNNYDEQTTNCSIIVHITILNKTKIFSLIILVIKPTVIDNIVQVVKVSIFVSVYKGLLITTTMTIIRIVFVISVKVV